MDYKTSNALFANYHYELSDNTVHKINMLLQRIGIENIAKETGIDEYSKKLNLREHLKLLIYSIIYDCVTLTMLCDSLQSRDAEKNGLISIIKAQLSV